MFGIKKAIGQAGFTREYISDSRMLKLLRVDGTFQDNFQQTGQVFLVQGETLIAFSTRWNNG